MITKKFKIFIILLGLAFLFFGSYEIFTTYNKTRNFTQTSGQVTNIIRIQQVGQRVNNYYYPEVTFKTTGGQITDFIYYKSLDPTGYQIGETVPVMYNPQNPKDALINSLFDLWFLSFLSLIIGVTSVVLVSKIKTKS